MAKIFDNVAEAKFDSKRGRYYAFALQMIPSCADEQGRVFLLEYFEPIPHQFARVRQSWHNTKEEMLAALLALIAGVDKPQTAVV